MNNYPPGGCPGKILVVAAHPDDEILGCGASIKKMTIQGWEAYAVILAQGIASRFIVSQQNSSEFNKELHALQNDSLTAAKLIGYSKVYFEEFPDNRMDSVDLLDVVQKVEAYIKKIEPIIIFTHHGDDLNVDHRITYESVITACRPLADSTVESIYSFQIPSSTEWRFPYHKHSFSPNTFVDVKDTIASKIEAMNCYKSEIRQAPHPRSGEIIESIAKQWGSVANLEYAEAFELIYNIVKSW